MQFRDSETQKLLRDTVRSYLADKFPAQRLYAIERGEEQVAGPQLKEFADLGWLGLLAPESAGGAGASLLDAAVVSEEFGYGAVPAPVTLSNVATYVLARAPVAAAEAHLKNLAAGARFYTVSESTRRQERLAYWGHPPGAPLSASGGRLNGVLPLVPFADVADFALAPLVVDGEAAFAVLDLAQARRQQVKLLDRASYFHLHFDNVALGDSLILARGQQAAEQHEQCDVLATGLTLIELVGLMKRVTEMTGEYIANRVQFGQPIAKFQAARHRAAEMLMRTETSRWAAYYALWRLQEDDSDAQEIWLAKHWAIRGAETVYCNGHMLHGGIGVGIEHPLHLYSQQIASFLVRAGNLNEMVNRTVDSLDVRSVSVSVQ